MKFACSALFTLVGTTLLTACANLTPPPAVTREHDVRTTLFNSTTLLPHRHVRACA